MTSASRPLPCAPPLPPRLPVMHILPLLLACLAGCADRAPLRQPDVVATLRAEMAQQPRAGSAPQPAAAAAAPAPAPAPASALAPAEPRFDLIVTGAQSRDVFLSMVGDTHYSMLMHPEVSGTMSVTLRSVTVREALESIRDVYGYDFRMEGRRITVYPPTLQTRIFTINYPTSQRRGRSEVRVSGGSAPANNSGGGGGGGGNSGSSASNSAAAAPDSSQITTLSNSDFWTETTEALRGMLGKGEGRSVFTSPQAGTLAVRAMPDELRQVELFLRASRGAIERQVMIEAKIVEVELREGYQSGIDWSLLRSQAAAGQLSGVASNALLGNPNGLPTLPQAAAALLLDGVGLAASGTGTLGLSIAAKGFQAVLGFLETHGNVQILSSPRVATLNNQKAVLKVGTDEYFVTNVSGGSISAGTAGSNGTTTLPTLTLTPFFSGIALDVTPQIDEANMITLHLRPSVTAVTEKIKQIDLGTIGSYKLPLASSSVNETDTVVRVPDGNIVAIGGLMTSEANRSRSGLPGSDGNVFTRNLLGNQGTQMRKKELVVLIRPTIIRSAEDWQRSTEQAMAGLSGAPQRTVVVNAAPAAAVGAASVAGSAGHASVAAVAPARPARE